LRWNTAWTIVRDVLLTGTGIFLVLKQAYSLHPNDAILAVAMGFTAPSAVDHVKALLSGPSDAPSSPPSPPPASLPPSPPQEVPGE
jgi:hypothetical protein